MGPAMTIGNKDILMPEKNKGFTWIGVLGVIVIIAILAALVLNTTSGPVPRSAHERAAREISALSTALESYKVEYGDYPIATNALGLKSKANANSLYQALSISNAANNPSGKIFFEPYKGIAATTNYDSSSNYFVDPFGHPYQYRYPGDPKKGGTNALIIFSYGDSRKTSDEPGSWESWIKNW
jgi:type II secretory pathway pseudopilin PulG